jgi:hypothetical protein
VTTVVLSGIGMLTVLLLLAVGFAARRRLRRLRRRFTAARARIFELQARVQPPGPRRDADLLRHRLQAEIRATREMLTDRPDGLIFRADAAVVLHELTTTATGLDRELEAIGRFLDVNQQRAAFATLRPQADQLIETTYVARQTALRTAAEDRSRRIAGLQADVARQAAALETYRRSDRELQL